LLAPFMASAAALSSGLPIRGTLLSAVCAISTTEVPEVRSSQPTRQVIGSTTLVVAEESEVWLLLDRRADLMFEPGAWIREQQAAGLLVVISVPEFFDPWLSAELARQGVVLNDESCASSVGELGQLLQPDRIAFTSNYRLEDDYALLTRVTQQAEITWIGPELCARPERLDSVGSCPNGETSFISDIPSLEPVDSVVGLTSIVIPVYGMWELTRSCIASIRQNTPEAHEIIVVDDCSPDQTLNELAKLDLITVANEENLGFPGAVNAGLRRARGEFVCVLNNDTEVTPNWLGEMLGVLDRESVGMVGPRSNCITGRQAVPKTPQLNEAERAHRWARLWSAERAGVSWPTNTLIGFCLLSRRDLYEQLGAFEEGYGHGNFEDLDMSLRIRDAGHTLRVADGSVVLHHGSATFATSGIDLEALMHQTHQRFGERDIHAGGLLTALVLSDGDGDVARASAASAVAIADETIVLERGCFFDAELLTAAGGLVGVRSISLDWADGEQLSTFVSSLESEWIVVLGAGEDLVVNECGRARSELDGRSGSSAAVRTSGGSQIRVHAPVPEAIEAIGLEAQNPLQRILIRQAL
ncbi:MAG: glycosyltransferase family 2 protein, partial [Acidimicrobiales bacterium]